MYLLVFVTLMIAIIGMYTQVLGLQAARFASSQSGIGSAMLQWHTAAVSMAVSIIKTNPAGYTPAIATAGCSLTYTIPPNVTGIARCPSPQFSPTYQGVTYPQTPAPPIGGPINASGTITDGSATPIINRINYFHPAPPATTAFFSDECVHLATTCSVADTSPGNNGCKANNCVSGYDTVHYQFYSVLYQDATTGQNLVITFLPAPVPSVTNPPPGYLYSAATAGTGTTGANLGIGASDLLRQLSNAGAPSYSYGSFQKFGAPTNTPQLAVTGLTYNLPTTLNSLCGGTYAGTCTANGGVAVIGSPDGF